MGLRVYQEMVAANYYLALKQSCGRVDVIIVRGNGDEVDTMLTLCEDRGLYLRCQVNEDAAKSLNLPLDCNGRLRVGNLEDVNSAQFDVLK